MLRISLSCSFKTPRINLLGAVALHCIKMLYFLRAASFCHFLAAIMLSFLELITFDDLELITFDDLDRQEMKQEAEFDLASSFVGARMNAKKLHIGNCWLVAG